MSSRQGERVKLPLLPNNVGKKSVNDGGPRQGHDKILFTKTFQISYVRSGPNGCLILFSAEHLSKLFLLKILKFSSNRKNKNRQDTN